MAAPLIHSPILPSIIFLIVLCLTIPVIRCSLFLTVFTSDAISLSACVVLLFSVLLSLSHVCMYVFVHTFIYICTWCVYRCMCRCGQMFVSLDLHPMYWDRSLIETGVHYLTRLDPVVALSHFLQLWDYRHSLTWILYKC